MKKGLKILLIVVFTLLLLIAILLIFLSPIAKSFINHHGKDLTGRVVSVDKLRINPLSGRIKIYNLNLYEDDDSTVFFSFDTLDVSLKIRKLISKSVYVRHISLVTPKVRIVQDGSLFNFSSLINHFASDEPKNDSDTSSSSWNLAFYNIRLAHGEVFYEDLKKSSQWDVNNLNINIPGVYFDGKSNTEAGLDLNFADGGTLHTLLSLNLDNNDFDVQLNLDQFSVSNLQAYLASAMNIHNLEGSLAANLHVDGNLSEIMNLHLFGNIALNRINAFSSPNDCFLSLNKLALDIDSISLENNHFVLRSILFDGLNAHFDLDKNGNNFKRLFSVPKNQSVTPEVVEVVNSDTINTLKSNKQLYFQVGSLSVSNSAFTYNDFTLPDHFSFPLTNISISANNIVSSGTNAARIKATLPHGGLASIVWNGNINDWKSAQSLALSIRNLQLRDLSPYSVAYLGYPFVDGTFSFTSENSIRFSQLSGQNILDLYNPSVGRKRKDVSAQVNLPIRAALYILKDKDNKIEFDVPVSGNIDSPEFSYMKIVWKTLGNLLVKVASSPFRLLTGSDNSLQSIEFDPLSLNLNSEQYNKLSKIASVLLRDTSVVLCFEQHCALEQASRQLSLFNLKSDFYFKQHPEKQSSAQLELIDANNIHSISLSTAGFKSYLEQRSGTIISSESQLLELAQSLYPSDSSASALRSLADQRNLFLFNYFVNQMGVLSNQISFSPLIEDASKNEYVLTSNLKQE